MLDIIITKVSIFVNSVSALLIVHSMVVIGEKDTAHYPPLIMEHFLLPGAIASIVRTSALQGAGRSCSTAVFVLT